MYTPRVSVDSALIRVPTVVRDQVRSEALKRGISQSDVLILAMREFGQTESACSQCGAAR